MTGDASGLTAISICQILPAESSETSASSRTGTEVQQPFSAAQLNGRDRPHPVG